MIRRNESSVLASTCVFELLDDYAKSGVTVRWPIDADLAANVKVSYRTQLATMLHNATAEEINRRYVYMGDKQMSRMLDLVQQRVFRKELSGVGIELGSGSGLLAAVAASRPRVQGVLAVEVCDQFDVLIQKVARSVLGDGARKVVPVVGSFDDLRLPDESLDFALDHDSLHHSDDLPKTMAECSRVLKPGAFLICFDRCHPNSVTDARV